MGEGRRPEIVLTLAENSLQNFISSAWRGRMDVVRETRTCMVMGTAAPKAAPAHTPNPARSKQSPSLPLCLWPPAFSANWWGRGRGRWGQGQDWANLPQLSLPHTVETRRPHGILTASLRVGMVVTPTVQRRKLRQRTGPEAKSHSQHTTWQGCIRNLGSPAPEFASSHHPSPSLPPSFLVVITRAPVGSTGA